MKIRKDIFDNELDLTNKCLGCEIVNKNIQTPFGIMLETYNFVVFQDPEIPIPGFMIINSKRHIKSILNMERQEYSELMNLVYKVRKTMMNLTEIIDVVIIQKELSPHFHLWLMPRYEWMTNNSALGLSHGKLSDFTEAIKYSKEHHKNDTNISKIKECCEIIRKALNSNIE